MKLTALKIAAAASAALALAAGVALATRGDSTHVRAQTAAGKSSVVVAACVGQDGFVRVIASVGSCRAGERALSWASKGDPGPPGSRGPTGARGAAGKAGDAGAPGPRGGQGPSGTRGAAGAAGAAGARGPAGVPGQAGETGARGAQGPAGPAGVQGFPGAVGARGDRGPTGHIGVTGAAGPAGPGVGSFDDLAGTQCTAPTGNGLVQITYDALSHATLSCLVAYPAAAVVRVNEIATGTSALAADEFVEIVNAGGAPTDISGWKLVYRSSAGTSDTTLATVPSGTTIAAGGFYLFGGSAYAGAHAADQSFATGLASAGGGVGVRDENGVVVDSAGWGTATNAYVEGTVAPAPPTTASPGASIARKPDGHDTDNNAADLSIASVATPRAAN